LAAFFAGFAGRDLPNEPCDLLPFAVFLSPLPMIIFLVIDEVTKIKKTPNSRGLILLT
jgi:hypothetical protein